MDNREGQEQKTGIPAAAPYVRTRRSAAARAAAAAAQQAAASAGFKPMRPLEPDQTPAVQKHAAENALVAPVVYDPSGRELRMPSVSPVNLNVEGKGRGVRSKTQFVIIAILLGLASGYFLLYLNEHNSLLSQTAISDLGEAGIVFHCFGGGGVIGLLWSFILSPVYKRLSSAVPAYAALLFLPVLLFILLPLVKLGGIAIVALVSLIGVLISAAVALFAAWVLICGG